MTRPLEGPADFERWFGEVWGLAKPEPFTAAILSSVHPEVTSVQPLFPTARGPAEFVAVFHRIFRLVPDMVATIDTCTVQGDSVVVVADCRGTAGRKPLVFTVSDHFTLTGDKILRRETSSDPTAIIRQLATRPRAWPAALRMQLNR